MTVVREPCPSCGGAGGGPFGPAGSAWDVEDYVCPRCEGVGMITLAEPTSQRPGLVKALSAESGANGADTREIAAKKAIG